MSKWTFFNDRFVEEKDALLHFRDLSIQRAYGIFDFFKVVDGSPIFFQEHLDRFYFSAKEMRLEIEYSTEQLKKLVFDLLEKNEIKDTGIKITLTGGYSPDGYQIAKSNLIIALQNFASPTQDQFEKGIRLISYEHQRQLPHIKTIDYIMPIWLQPLIKQQNADDVLYYKNGIISECPRSNIFMVTEDNQLVTPAKNILKGILRNKLIDLAKQNMQVKEREITLDEIKAAKEVFITSTTKTILPVSQIDDCMLPSSKSIARQLYKKISSLR